MDRRDMERDLEALHGSSIGWALNCCGWNMDDAEEVLQASYLKALDGKARFDGFSTLRTWFFGVVRRTASEHRRRRVVRSLGLGRWLERRTAPPPVRNPETVSRDAERRRRLRGMLERLAPRQRDLMHLVFYQELTIEEAAQVLGISLGSARTHYHRGKARLRGMLEGSEENHGQARREGTAAARTV